MPAILGSKIRLRVPVFLLLMSALLSLALLQLPPSSSSPVLPYSWEAMAEVQGGEGLTVWIPPKMLAGEKYTGVVIITAQDASDRPRDVLLVSSNAAVVVPERVTIGQGMHQARFEIDAVQREPAFLPVAASVSAVMEGTVGEASTHLYGSGDADGSRSISSSSSSSSTSTIRLLAFNTTNLSFARVVAVAGQPLGYDYHLFDDAVGTGTRAAGDTSITLAYPGGTANITIGGQTGYGVADVPLAEGANRISVVGRPGEAITVTMVPVDPAITVTVSALSIIPAWTPEWGYQRSWVLVDAELDGKPIRGDSQIVTATSSNPDVVEVEKGTVVCSLPCAIPVRGHSQGEARVGVQVTGIGGGTADIATVPPVRYMASVADMHAAASKYIMQSTSPSTRFAINGASLSGHSSESAISSAVTDGEKVYGLVGHYAVLSADYTTFAGEGNTTEITSALVQGQFSKKVPLVIPGVKYYMSSLSSSLSSSSSPPNGSVQAEWSFFSGLVRGGDAASRSSALTGGAPSGVVRSTSAIGVGSSHAAMSSFEVRLGEPAGGMKGELTAIALQEAGIQLAGYLVNGAVRGYPADNKGVSMVPPPLLHFALSLPPFPVTDTIRAPQAGPQLQVDVPPIVYPAEGFVFAAHIVHGGIPLQRVNPLYELGRAGPDRAGELQEIDSVFIHPRSGHVAKVTISAVMNAIDLDVLWPEVLKLDRQHDLTVITSVHGARIQVTGDVRGEVSKSDINSGKDGGASPNNNSSMVTLYPAGAEGDKTVIITASKAGWTSAAAEKVIPAKKYLNMTVDAFDRKGNPVYAPFILEYETIDGDRIKIEETAPHVFDVRPFALEPVLTFGDGPAESNEGSSYAYRLMREGDGVFTGVFERQARLTVLNGIGSGYFVPGESVQMEANPDSQILGFAVVERFSHWEYGGDSAYLPDKSARVQDIIITGDADVTITAVYVTDFTILAVLIISTAAAVGAYAYREEINTILEAYRRHR